YLTKTAHSIHRFVVIFLSWDHICRFRYPATYFGKTLTHLDGCIVTRGLLGTFSLYFRDHERARLVIAAHCTSGDAFNNRALQNQAYSPIAGDTHLEFHRTSLRIEGSSLHITWARKSHKVARNSGLIVKLQIH